MTYFDVISPGLLSTLQDGGRFGYEDKGVPPSGVLDELSFAIANALVGNHPGTGAIEFTLTGPTLRLSGDAHCFFSVTGDFSVTLNGAPCATYQNHRMQPGDILSIPRVISGARGYLSISGGFDVPPVLGSVSTLMRAQLGGFDGQPLHKGDRLPIAAQRHLICHDVRAERILPQMEKRAVRVVWGPQDDYFGDEARASFLTQTYSLSPQCDRMGYRLKGTPLVHAKGFNIISDAICAGSIQIPGDGQPIVAMNDRQTTGGYPKIATVIRADLARMGQMKPGDPVRFEAVSVEKAEDLWQGRQKILVQKLAALNKKVLAACP
ncbi:biotin-dependent carboxyltransferase family protein [Sodalis sp. dw_96]|uniref:5-oxoprolinase subunit C family protein n=1 Tax=Sodalis sp. dw_96 TaxID=2719794 RepID=UPI001BD3592B|nr:biotin-dependent carboxyltransferase family protein [Sodalis sp. dw_96]